MHVVLYKCSFCKAKWTSLAAANSCQRRDEDKQYDQEVETKRSTYKKQVAERHQKLCNAVNENATSLEEFIQGMEKLVLSETGVELKFTKYPHRYEENIEMGTSYNSNKIKFNGWRGKWEGTIKRPSTKSDFVTFTDFIEYNFMYMSSPGNSKSLKFKGVIIESGSSGYNNQPFEYKGAINIAELPKMLERQKEYLALFSEEAKYLEQTKVQKEKVYASFEETFTKSLEVQRLLKNIMTADASIKHIEKSTDEAIDRLISNRDTMIKKFNAEIEEYSKNKNLIRNRILNEVEEKAPQIYAIDAKYESYDKEKLKELRKVFG